MMMPQVPNQSPNSKTRLMIFTSPTKNLILLCSRLLEIKKLLEFVISMDDEFNKEELDCHTSEVLETFMHQDDKSKLKQNQTRNELVQMEFEVIEMVDKAFEIIFTFLKKNTSYQSNVMSLRNEIKNVPRRMNFRKNTNFKDRFFQSHLKSNLIVQTADVIEKVTEMKKSNRVLKKFECFNDFWGMFFQIRKIKEKYPYLSKCWLNPTLDAVVVDRNEL